MAGYGFGAKVKLTVDKSSKTEFNKQINAMVGSIKVSNKFTVLQKDMDRVRKEAQAMLNSHPITLKVNKIDCSSAVNDVKRQLQGMLSSLSVSNGVNITGLKDFLGTEGLSNTMRDTANAANTAVQKLKEARGEAANLSGQMKTLDTIVRSLNSTYKSGISGKNMITDEAQLSSITDRYRELISKTEELRALKAQASADDIVNAQNEAIALQREIAMIQSKQAEIQRTAAARDRETQAAERAAAANQKADTTWNEKGRYDAIARTSSAIDTLTKRQNAWSAAATGGTSRYYRDLQGCIAQLTVLKGELERGTITAEEYASRFSTINSSAKNASSAIIAANKNTLSLTDRMGSLASKFTAWLSVSQVIMYAVRSIRQMVTAVIDIDSAMTELKKVTDETDTTYQRFLTNAVSRAKELGAAVSDTVEATADFARLGYTIDEASQLADAAIIYKNVGDGIEDISEASESVISTMQAFGIAAEDAMLVVDKFNEVGNNFAISSKGVGDALMRSASALAAGNNTLDESIALITTANTVVQDPDVVGTTMKTISMYLRAAKTEAEEAGESTEGMANSVSELRSEILALTGNKVDIQIDEDNFKSTYQIIKELAAVWDDLTDISQANILEMIGGKRNSNVVSALLENFSLAESVVEESANAAGSALAENEKYLDSIEGKISEFSATFQEFSITLINSEFVKSVVEFGTGILDVLTALAKVIDTVGGLNTVLKVTLGIIIAMNTNSIAKFLTGLVKPIKSMIEVITAAKVAGIGFGQAMTNAFAQATAGATAFQVSLGVIGIAMAAISAVVGVVTAAYNHFHKSNEELIQDAEDLKTAYNDAFSEISGNLSTLRGLEDEFYELSRGVDDYGNNISLTADEYERYRDIVGTIVGISPELISGYDEEGNAIANKNGLLERSIKLMEEEQRLKMQEYVSDENLSTLLKGEVASLEETFKDIDIPNTIAYSGVKILDNGELERGYVNHISDYIEDAIGVAFNNEGIDTYIQNNADAIEKHIGEILDNASKDFTDDNGNTWQALTDSQIADLEAYILSITNAVQESSNTINQSLQYIPQTLTAYSDLTDGQKEFLTQYINTFSVTADTTEKDILQMKQDILDFTEFVADNDDLKDTIDLGLSIKYGVDEEGDSLSVADYKKRIDDFTSELSSYDSETQIKIKAAFGIETDTSEINEDVGKAIEHVKNLLQDEFDSEVDSLSVSDVLQVYYNISAEPNSMTFDELQEKIRLLGVNWQETVNVLDFSSMTDGLGEIESGVSGLISAMSKLKDGTKLTVGELANLALQYPQLLKQSDLFANGTIENQQAMLDAVLGCYESEYDALIDTKIAELTATNELINSQINLENEKKNKVIEIENLQANGKLESERDYQILLNELRDLEGQNYVTYSDGVLDVNKDMLENALKQQGDSVEESKPIWGAQGDMIVEANSDGLSGALKKYPIFLSNLKTWASSSLKTILSNIGTNISKAFSGDTDWVGLTSGVGSIGDIASTPITIETEVEGNFTIDDKSVDEWSASYKDTIEKRVQTLTEQITANEVIIDNLEKLKGLDLKTIYQNDSSSKKNTGSDKTVEEYIADIDEYYEALKRLESIQIHLSSLQDAIDNADSVDERVSLTKSLISVYQDEAEALEHLNTLRSKTIETNIAELEALGFQIDYNANTNEFYVRNLEHLNELQATSKGEYESLQEATNALREDTESLIDTLDSLNVANQDGVESIRELEETIYSTKDAIVEYFQEVVRGSNEVVDALQNVYDTFHSAANEYAENGFISVDALQSIYDLGPQYLQYLEDENGLLVINEERINAVIAAKTEQMALDTAMTYVERLRLAALGESNENLNDLIYATTEATTSTWGLVYAQLEQMRIAGEISDSQYAAAFHNIQSIQALAKNAISGIGHVADEAKSAMEDLKSELEDMQNGVNDIIEYVMDMLKQRVNDQIDALNEMKDAYSEIIALRKESLDAAKEESDYDEQVADKIQEIAKLQERINALSLDDSRDAQAQKISLEEEMAGLQKELADIQGDYAREAQQSALDDMQEAYEKQKDEEIEALEETISSYQKLYDMAIDYINNHWDSLYSELIEWNYEYGSVLNEEISDAWAQCEAAAQRYGSSVQSMLEGLKSEIAGLQSQLDNLGSSSSQNGSTTGNIIGPSDVDTSSSNEDNVKVIVSRMKQLGAQWSPLNSKEKNDQLHKEAAVEAAKLDQYGVHAEFDGSDGTWWITKDEINPSNVGKLLHSCYHTGGYVEDEAPLTRKEVPAILEKGELVLDEQKEKGLYRLIDFTTALSEKLGNALGSIGASGLFNLINNGPDETHAPIPSVNNNQTESIHFGDVYIYGGDESTVKQHQEINRKFTNDVLANLHIKK